MVSIAICVCTRKRPEGLNTLLKSIEELEIPDSCEFKVIVVENDTQAYTKDLVGVFQNRGLLSLHYFLESRQGISFARNRAVSESGSVDFCCFVDDDQRVDPKWLKELLKCQAEYDAPVVWGPNPPVFAFEVPVYIQKFHQPVLYEYGEIVEQGATNCLLVKKEWLDRVEGPFDLRLNFSGGEDSYLTQQITRLGGQIRFTPFAIAYELVPESRSTIAYVIKRTSRIANTQLIVRALSGNKFSKSGVLSKAIIRYIRGLIILIPYFIFAREEKLKGLFKMSYSAGVFRYFLGGKNKFYK